MRSPSGSAYNNVIRITEEKEKLIRELAERKGQLIALRINVEELAYIELIRRIIGAQSRSEAIRTAIRIAFGILSGADNIEAGRVIINNPIVNMNINQNNNEVKPTININLKPTDIEYLERLIQDLLLLLESKVDSKSMRVIRSRAAKAERILEEIRKGVVN